MSITHSSTRNKISSSSSSLSALLFYCHTMTDFFSFDTSYSTTHQTSDKLILISNVFITNIIQTDEFSSSCSNSAIIIFLSNLIILWWKIFIILLVCFSEYLCWLFFYIHFLHCCIATYVFFLKSKKTTIFNIFYDIKMNSVSAQALSSNKKHRAVTFLYLFFDIQSNFIVSSDWSIDVCMIITCLSKSALFLTFVSISTFNVTEQTNQKTWASNKLHS